VRVLLLSLVDETKHGGSAVYAAHLWRSFMQQGHEPVLLRVGARTEKKQRWFTHEVPYQNVSLQDACAWAAQAPALITYSHWKTHRLACLTMLALGVPIVIHDPAEFHDEMLATVRGSRVHVVAIRRPNAATLQERGVPAVFIPHPYVRSGLGGEGPRGVHAVCLGRVDFRKHHEIVCGANDLLPAAQQVRIHGPLNRIFAYHTLDARFTGWRRNYEGPYPTEPSAAVRIMERAKWVVDLTVIKSGDGDGSQYTFMEAWDAGTPLVVHRNWIRTGTDEVRDCATAVAVGDANELAAVLQRPPPPALVDGGRAQLACHAPERVVPQYMEALGWRQA
jgi:hypothetical protein